MSKSLYLLGGDPNLFETNEAFIKDAGGKDARIALLFANSPGWEDYLSLYTDVWDEIGIGGYDLIVPDENQNITDGQREKIKAASGIFIGGGVPELYYKAYVLDAETKNAIKEKHQSGTPVAACSAGALILPEKTYLLTMEGEVIGFVPGMGLVSDVVIGVHYTEYAQEGVLQRAMEECGVPGIGIDEGSCARFVDGKYEGFHGKPVHRKEV